MFTTDWLSALDRRFHLTNRARPRRPRVSRRLRVAAELAPLEDRCLMSRTVPHTRPPVERLTTPPASGVIVIAGQQRDRAGSRDVSESSSKDDGYL